MNVTWGDAPTLTVRVSVVTASIPSNSLDAGSVVRGYDFLEKSSSCVHVNVNASSSILITLLAWRIPFAVAETNVCASLLLQGASLRHCMSKVSWVTALTVIHLPLIGWPGLGYDSCPPPL